MFVVFINSILMSGTMMALGAFIVNLLGLPDSLYTITVIITAIVVYAGYFVPEHDKMMRKEHEDRIRRRQNGRKED